jgi:hypothetical protein
MLCAAWILIGGERGGLALRFLEDLERHCLDPTWEEGSADETIAGSVETLDKADRLTEPVLASRLVPGDVPLQKDAFPTGGNWGLK